MSEKIHDEFYDDYLVTQMYKLGQSEKPKAALQLQYFEQEYHRITDEIYSPGDMQHDQDSDNDKLFQVDVTERMIRILEKLRSPLLETYLKQNVLIDADEIEIEDELTESQDIDRVTEFV